MSRGFNEAKIAKAPQIRDQLREGRQRGASHMIRMQNTQTEEIFPLFVNPRKTPRQQFAEFVEKNGTHFDPIECYDFSMDLENQVLADRTVNWDQNLPVQTGPFSAVFPFDGQGPNMPNPEDD